MTEGEHRAADRTHDRPPPPARRAGAPLGVLPVLEYSSLTPAAGRLVEVTETYDAVSVYLRPRLLRLLSMTSAVLTVVAAILAMVALIRAVSGLRGLSGTLCTTLGALGFATLAGWSAQECKGRTFVVTRTTLVADLPGGLWKVRLTLPRAVIRHIGTRGAGLLIRTTGGEEVVRLRSADESRVVAGVLRDALGLPVSDDPAPGYTPAS
jgi:hypothetical protein